ncbi:MAG TPA: YbgF trimerization domain-containing protein [Cellvibrio sp.]|nr:YbgF trimerization domain-containing protein [Cellvibrio sp.]
MSKYLLAAVLFIAVPVSQAQVRVVESSPQRPLSGVAQPIESVNAQTNAYFELQSLKEEVSLLRGLVEEQAHEISRLKQQQMDNYLDLDKRLNALSGGSNPAPVDTHLLPPSPVESAGGGVSTPNSNSAFGEAEVYAAAYNLLKQRQIDPAIAAFKDHLSRFPDGAYAGNSYYWLGEIYLLKNELSDSRDWFTQLLEKFPNDRKVPDAKFKLGKVYHLLGEDDQGKKLLEGVAAGSGDSARLAKQYLQENF